MQKEITFISAGWDFDSIWFIAEEGFTYPELDCECTTMHVSSIDLELQQGGPLGPKKNWVKAWVTVVNCFGRPVEAAKVSTRWTGIVSPEEEPQEYTNSLGEATFIVKDDDAGYFLVNVHDVYKAGWTWDEEASVTDANLLNY